MQLLKLKVKNTQNSIDVQNKVLLFDVLLGSDNSVLSRDKNERLSCKEMKL